MTISKSIRTVAFNHTRLEFDRSFAQYSPTSIACIANFGEKRGSYLNQNCFSRVVYRANHEEWVIALIAAGLGIAIMPEWQDIPGVVYISIADLVLHRTIGVVWRAGQDSEVSDRFRAFASSHNW